MNKLQQARDKWLHAQALAVEAKVEYLGVIRLAERELGFAPKRAAIDSNEYVSWLLKRQAE